MSYEYKEEILLDIGPEPTCNYESESNRYYDKIDELNHVYSQAAKADEYEAKAKAYDRVAEKLYARINHIIMTSDPAQCKPGYVDGLYNALDIISSELESGESE